VQYETCPRIPGIDYVKELDLGGLAALFGSSEEKPQDSEKLMDLYWNRAELKKSFADARKEHFRLQDKIKQQEGATARLQQKLDHLEELLIDSQWAHNVVVFYQLRGLAQRCERKLANFAEQLKQQWEQKLHGDMISGWKAQLAEESAQIEERLLVHRAEIQKGEEQLEAERQQLESMGVLQRLFKGRSVKAVLKQLELQIETARAEETTLLDNLAVINDREPPKSEGLDISSKRSINLMIVAFAQQLYLQFADSDFATLVKDAGDKSVGSTNYGNQHECGRILERIEDRAAVMEQSTDFAGVLQKRVKLIGEKATFRNKSDVVPVAATVSTVFDIGESGMVSEREADLLGENYWRISKVLSR
jgi:hypothetical protein